jgi:small subunit ribosomal protein S1
MASDAVEKMEDPQNTAENETATPDAATPSNGENDAPPTEPVAEATEPAESIAAPGADSADTVADATESSEDTVDDAAASETVETGDVTEADAATQEDTPDLVAEVAEEAEAVEEETAEAIEDKVIEASTESTVEAAPESTEGEDAVVAEDDGPKTIADIQLKQEIHGKVVKTTLGGAFVDFGIDVLGFLHISQLSENPIKNVTDVVEEGADVTAYVLGIKHSEGRVSLSLLKPPALLWSELAAMVNETVTGEVKRIEKFGAFVDIGAERDGLIHVSELSDEYVGSPESVVSIGEQVTARIINVDTRKKQVDLSIKALNVPVIEEEEEDEEESVTAMELAMRKAMDRDKKKNRRKKSRGRRNEQADIIARTLQAQRDNK